MAAVAACLESSRAGDAVTSVGFESTAEPWFSLETGRSKISSSDDKTATRASKRRERMAGVVGWAVRTNGYTAVQGCCSFRTAFCSKAYQTTPKSVNDCFAAYFMSSFTVGSMASAHIW